MTVSIYMPTRNRRALLETAVSSVVAQTVSDWELIVVDDASTDGTDAYLAELAARDGRVKVIRQAQALGAPTARNLAISQASGAFVTGLDDDDEFLPHRLEVFLGAWDLYRAAGLAPAGLYAQDIWTDGGEPVMTTTRRGTISAEDLPQSNQIGNQIFAPKEHYITAGLFDVDLPAWQDIEFFYRLLKAHGPARLVDVATYRFDVTRRPDRISLQSQKLRRAYAAFCDKHLERGRSRQQLALQLFSEYYDIKPKMQDVVEFARNGPWPRGLALLVRRGLERG